MVIIFVFSLPDHMLLTKSSMQRELQVLGLIPYTLACQSSGTLYIKKARMNGASVPNLE